ADINQGVMRLEALRHEEIELQSAEFLPQTAHEIAVSTGGDFAVGQLFPVWVNALHSPLLSCVSVASRLDSRRATITGRRQRSTPQFSVTPPETSRPVFMALTRRTAAFVFRIARHPGEMPWGVAERGLSLATLPCSC